MTLIDLCSNRQMFENISITLKTWLMIFPLNILVRPGNGKLRKKNFHGQPHEREFYNWNMIL